MSSLSLAEAVFQHAHDHYDTGAWYVVAECWDVPAIAEALDQATETTGRRFVHEADAISHFHRMIHPRQRGRPH